MKVRATLALALVVGVAACGSKDKPTGKKVVAPVKIPDKDIPEGFDLRLSDGKQNAPPYDASKLAPVVSRVGSAPDIYYRPV